MELTRRGACNGVADDISDGLVVGMLGLAAHLEILLATKMGSKQGDFHGQCIRYIYIYIGKSPLAGLGWLHLIWGSWGKNC
jgi:hypothetical protein